MKGFREHICISPLSFLTNPFSKKISSEGLCLRVSFQAIKETMETVLETILRSLLQTRTNNLVDFSFSRGVTNLLSEFLLPHLINMPRSKKFCWSLSPLHSYPGVVKLVGHIIHKKTHSRQFRTSFLFLKRTQPYLKSPHDWKCTMQ